MDLLYLNQLAQGVRSLDESIRLIQSDILSGRRAIQYLAFMADQASAKDADVEMAIVSAGLPHEFSVPLQPSKRRVADVADEQVTSAFRYLLELYRIADKRRRIQCGAPNCGHWWHQDLSDPQILCAVEDMFTAQRQRRN